MADDVLAELLDAQLGAGLQDFDPNAPLISGAGLVAPGLGRTESLSELAQLLAGTSDKRSREYRSARRQVERWSPSDRQLARGAKPRRPTPRSRERLVAVRRQQDSRLRAFRAHGGEMRLQVSWYSTRRAEWLPPGRWLHVRQPVMRRVVRDWDAGDHLLAAGALFAEFMAQYQVPNPDDWARDVVVVDLMLEPAE